MNDIKRWTLIALTGFVAACAFHVPDLEPTRPPWPVKDDGSAYARCINENDVCCATEGGLGEWEVRSCPTPEPTPDPTPDPTPEPTPEPTPDPTPDP